MGWFSKKPEAHTALEMRESELLDRLEEVTRELAEVRGTFDGTKTAVKLAQQINTLREEISTLKVDKSVLTEAHNREKREVEHEVGLHRKQMDFELDSARREALLEVREANLDHERKAFEEQQAFRQEQFDGQITYIKDITAQILERLPAIGVKLSDTRTTTVGGKPAPEADE